MTDLICYNSVEDGCSSVTRNPVAHFVLFSDLRRMTDLICLDRRMTVCDENPVAQLVFF